MTERKKLLLVDADRLLRQSLTEQLEGEFTILSAGDSARAREILAAERIDVILLGDLDAAEGLEENETVVPVLPLSKPIRLGALQTWLRGRIAEVAIGPFRFHPLNRLLVHAQTNSRIRLTEKEAAILEFLYAAKDAVARQALLDEVWGYNPAATTHTLETHVYRLRQKIERDPAHAEILVTEAGGYRLIA